MRSFVLPLSLVGLLSVVACGDDGSSSGGAPPGDGGGGAVAVGGSGGVASTGGADAGGAAAGGASAGGASSGGGGTGGSSAQFVGRCGDPIPDGAPAAAPLPTYAGTCPTLTPGFNTISSSGADREFLLVLPSDYDPTVSYPVFFLWHWLGGDAQDFFTRAEVQAAADTQQFIAVLPEKKGDLLFTWPFEKTQSQARVDEELAFFDDMLACVGAGLSIDTECVSSVGVSAGALFTGQLAHSRSTHLASFVSLSGGTGGFAIRDWETAEHRLPALVLWGGSEDTCQSVLSFETLSADLEANLTEDGHFMVECIHNCGHSEPPFEGPQGFSKYKGMWDFILAHPYWVSDGLSVFETDGITPDLPEWCAIGAGNATERTGECLNPSEC
jgi:predicted esterase